MPLEICGGPAVSPLIRRAPKLMERSEASLSVDYGTELKDILMAEKVKEQPQCAMTFHVTDSTEILASVSKMAEAGNIVKFGPQEATVTCTKTARVAKLRKENGIYLMKVLFHTVEGDVEGPIVIDPGAAEHVMPKDILNGETMMERNAYVNFVAANGKLMGNYGRKALKFTPEGFQRQV